jgi:hypothetical protein
MRYYLKGDTVRVDKHTSKPKQGLSYQAFTGVLLEDVGCSKGWDVVDVETEGQTVSIYCFSIDRNAD